MNRTIEHDIESILKAVLEERVQGLPSHNTAAIKAAVSRLLPHDVVYVEDNSYYYEELYVSEVVAVIDKQCYVIKMCFDSGYYVCYKMKN